LFKGDFFVAPKSFYQKIRVNRQKGGAKKWDIWHNIGKLLT